MIDKWVVVGEETGRSYGAVFAICGVSTNRLSLRDWLLVLLNVGSFEIPSFLTSDANAGVFWLF